MSEQHFINLLSHLSQRLEALTAEIPNAIQPRDASLLHPPTKALEIAKEINETLLHELEPLSEQEPTHWLNFLDGLHTEVTIIMFTIQDGLGYFLISGPTTYCAEIEEYKNYCVSLTTKAIQKIKDLLDPIIQKQLEALKAEYGQPMAIAIKPYRPWDVPPPPETEFQRLYREAQSINTGPCLALQLAPKQEPDSLNVAWGKITSKDHWRTCSKESGTEGKDWPLCCAEASRVFSQKTEELGL